MATRNERLRIAEMLVLTAGIAVSLWITLPILGQPYDASDGDPIQLIPVFLRVIIAVLGGVSFVGVPILLLRLRRDRSRWGPGKMAWFAHGTASWLLWPPIIHWQVTAKGEMPWSAVCWLWGTPLMGVYVTASLLAGGWLGRRARKRMRRSWGEQCGILLALAWAATGLYLIGLLYWIDLFKKP